MPKYAVLSDIHSNADAFEVVLAKCRELGVERYISLGDIIGYNAEPARCIEMAQELNFVAMVRGNHDEYTVRGNMELSGFNANAKAAINWTRQQLSGEHLEWLSTMKYSEKLRDADSELPLDCNITLVHATLDTPENWGYIFDAHHAIANFNYQLTPICFCGHSHVPVAFDKRPSAMRNERSTEEIPGWRFNEKNPAADEDFSIADSLQVEFKKGHKYLFNIGSIGQPRNGDPRASFAVIDTSSRTVTRYRLPYDVMAAHAKVREAGLPERLANRLLSGH